MATDSVVPERLETAIDTLQEAFAWSDTPQGFNYWQQVLRNLESLRPASAQETAAAPKSAFTIECENCTAKADLPYVGRENEFLSLHPAYGWEIYPRRLCPGCKDKPL